MGTSRSHLLAIIQRAVKQGWLKFDDPISTIKHQIVPKVVKNLNKFLDNEDKTVTLETAKGTIFREYQQAMGIQDGAQTVLALKIEYPNPPDLEQSSVDNPPMKPITGEIIGTPKYLEQSSLEQGSIED